MFNNYKKAVVNGRMTTVMNPYDVLSNNVFHNKFTSVEYDGLVLPVKTSYDPTSPGFYITSNGKVGKLIKPSNDEMNEYSAANAVDFSNIEDMKELINKQDQVKQMEAEILSNSDNLFKPVIKDNDSPEMKALKQAICLKNIDIDLYSDRFGDNYNNDKRLLKGSSITMSKLKSYCNSLDMKCTIIISDKNENVPNPMNQQVIVDICGYDDDSE